MRTASSERTPRASEPEARPPREASDFANRQPSGQRFSLRARLDRPAVRLGGFSVALVLALVVGAGVGTVAGPAPALR